MLDSNAHCTTYCSDTPKKLEKTEHSDCCGNGCNLCELQLPDHQESGRDAHLEPDEGTSAICTLCKSLPEKPEKPEPIDCCGNGCTPCVFDIYDQELKKWEQECAGIQAGIVSDVDNSERPVLAKDEYSRFKLTSIQKVSEDSCIYRFSLSANQSLGLEPGQHLIMRGVVDGKRVTRQYTPISPHGVCGYFDVLIKIYEFGKMSSYVKSWQKGELVEWRGPFGQFTYTPNKFRHIGMLAAGTGIAPMASIIVEVLNNEDDETFITFLYACRKYNSVLLKSYLDEWSAFWNFKVIYALSQEDEKQSCGKYGEHINYGRINKECISNNIPLPCNNTIILVCGTNKFDQDMIGFLKELKYDSKLYFKF